MRKMFAFALILCGFSQGLWAQNTLEEIAISKTTDFTEYPETEIMPEELDLSGFPGARLLEETNDKSGTDAYPWLSDDGLRLYFTQSHGGDKIMVASRADANSQFSTPVALDINFDQGDNMSCWLSKDELNIYFVATNEGRQLYVAKRAAINLPFESPQAINLIADDYLGFYTAPSITPDGQQLFLYQNNERRSILYFERSAEMEYTLKGQLPIPGDQQVSPGQLSKDGLTYICHIHRSKDMLVYQREELEDPFQQSYIHNMKTAFHQPSLSADWIVLGLSPNDTWAGNELYIAPNPFNNSSTNPSSNSFSLTVQPELKLFPNPAKELINLQFEIPSTIDDARLEVVDLQGRILHQQQISGRGKQQVQLNIQDFLPGSYFCRIQADNNAITEMLLIK